MKQKAPQRPLEAPVRRLGVCVAPVAYITSLGRLVGAYRRGGRCVLLVMRGLGVEEIWQKSLKSLTLGAEALFPP